MSKIDPISPVNRSSASYQSNLERLKAVESVTGLVSDMVENTEVATFALSADSQLGHAYENSLPMVQHRFDRLCDELTIVARTGAQSLLTSKSAGRTNLDAAANSLLREIEKTSAKLVRLLRG